MGVMKFTYLQKMKSDQGKNKNLSMYGIGIFKKIKVIRKEKYNDSISKLIF